MLPPLIFCVIIPVANEEHVLPALAEAIKRNLDKIGGGKVFFIVDKASTDSTLTVCRGIAELDNRFQVVWAPENTNVVDAYLRGYRETCTSFDYIVEMDAGFSHDPDALPAFIEKLSEGYDVVYGSRFMKGGTMSGAGPIRFFLSRGGTFLSRILLGIRMQDMTSGFIGMKSAVARQFASRPFLSKGHFYQTELRYLLRGLNFIEIPIHYSSPSKRMTFRSVWNSIHVLLHYFYLRLTQKPT